MNRPTIIVSANHEDGGQQESSCVESIRRDFLEVTDCSEPPRGPATKAHLVTLRRSSSLQFPSPRRSPSPSAAFGASPNFLHSAMATLKTSSASIYASTLSAAGLLGGVGLGGLRSHSSASSAEAMNLYSMMTDYRCCCGLFRLRIGSLLVGLSTCLAATLILSSLLINTPFSPASVLSTWHFQMLCRPAVLLCSYALLASILMLLALVTDLYHLILPFLLSCMLNMMASMTLGVILLLSPRSPAEQQLTPTSPTPRHFEHSIRPEWSPNELMPAALALLSSALVVLFLWFLVIVSFTYVLIRDKRSLFAEYFSGLDDDDDQLVMIRRSSSAPLERVNSAEF